MVVALHHALLSRSGLNQRKRTKSKEAVEAIVEPESLADEDHDPGDDSEDDEDRLEAEKAEAFFEDGDGDGVSVGFEEGGSGVPFQQLNLSRPLLRAVEAMGFVSPTPIQQRAIPYALAGR